MGFAEEWLGDMLEAIERIKRYATHREASLESELIQVWVIYHLVLVGEAARHYRRLRSDAAPLKVWKEVVDLRNFLVHEYFHMDLELIWSTVEQDIPQLEMQLRELLDVHQAEG